MSDEAIELSGSQTLRVVQSTPDLLEVESTWTASEKKPQRHFHPNQDERFEVLEGALTVELNGEPPRLLYPGDTLDVPRRTVHRMWNAGPERVRATWRVTPSLRTEEMFRFIGAGMSGLRIPVLLARFRNEFRLPLLP